MQPYGLVIPAGGPTSSVREDPSVHGFEEGVPTAATGVVREVRFWRHSQLGVASHHLRLEISCD